MQFKHPEALYFLGLLIIPILIHLFQLQKFVKIPFTNVAFLQKLIVQTRKSSRLKKWLILCTRLMLFLALFFAFSQPYFSNKSIAKNQHNFIYLDNSLSTNAKGEKGKLLQIASQEIIENISEKDIFSLLTNNNYYKNITASELKNILFNIKNTAKTLSLKEVLLKIEHQNKNKTKTLYKNILISDFQNTYDNYFTNVNQKISLINLKNSLKNNLSIDSLFINNKNSNNFTLNIRVKNQGVKKENIPIAVFNNTNLISKQSFSIEENVSKTISFAIQKKNIFLGKINMPYSDTFDFDNTYFFTLNANKKTSVLSIGNPSDFLSKIYTNNKFNFAHSSVKNINYNNLSKQELIILNDIKEIPTTLSSSLIKYSKNGGHLVIIPNQKINIASYNLLLKELTGGRITRAKTDTLKITNINFKHPLLKDVFLKKVENFQYPIAQNNYTSLFSNASAIISLENGTPFIQQIKNKTSRLYFVSASLSKENSNFTNSPLVVPVFYNIAQQSYKHSKLYYTVDNLNIIDIDTQLKKDEVLTISKANNNFIPLQQTKQNSVSITTEDKPLIAGFYHILKQKDTIKSLAFNYPKEESNLSFLIINNLAKEKNNISVSNSVKEIFTEINKNNKVTWLWQWFLALAIVSLLLEILILKFFKV